MRNFLRFLALSTIVFAISSCEKQENKIYYEGGTPPVLTASATGPFVLDKNRASEFLIRFNWTNPDYKFTTGVSSQNVTYTLQVDVAGGNFASPKLVESAIANDLSVSYTVKQFNSFFSRMELPFGVAQQVQFRVKSTLAGSSVPLYSNVLNMTVTPYLDFVVEPPGTAANNYNDGNLWVIGDCFGAPNWTNPLPSPQDVNHKFTKIDILHYELVINFVSGGGYKLIQTQGVWGTQYHAITAGMALDGDFEKRDADPQFASPGAGRYKIQVNFQTGKYKLTPQ